MRFGFPEWLVKIAHFQELSAKQEMAPARGTEAIILGLPVTVIDGKNLW
jgi:hypothetical protein